jgi:hypothetical protein
MKKDYENALVKVDDIEMRKLFAGLYKKQRKKFLIS